LKTQPTNNTEKQAENPNSDGLILSISRYNQSSK